MCPPALQWHERLYHRDQLRAARYSALADAEGFQAVCFALEALGLRLLERKADLGKYKPKLLNLSKESFVLTEMSQIHAGMFGKFEALFDFVRTARNDAMHTGVYARHATTVAIELCIGLEEALMKENELPRCLVEDFMVKTPITIEDWQPVAHARQLMLMHSFTFLPVLLGSWKLVTEVALARYLHSYPDWTTLVSATIKDATDNGLNLIDAKVIGLKDNIQELLNDLPNEAETRLWLVQDDHGKLCGVLSPYELM